MRGIVIIFSVIIAAILGLVGVFENEAMYGVIHGDAQGYYGYLVALFLENSFDWEQVIHSYSDVYFNGNGADFTVTSELGRINKYYVGTSLLMLPFFLISCLAALFLGFPLDGYSAPFQVGIMLSALFYVGVGMYFLSKFFESHGIKTGVSLFVVVLCLFATNLFHYSISEPAMSHAYSFSLFCLFLYTTDRWLKTDSWYKLLSVAGIFGLIVLVRPANGLILFSVPFLAGGIVPLREKLRNTKSLVLKLAGGIMLVVAILSLQSIMYMIQVGEPLVWSYQGEGFNFSDPEIVNLLFSYKKGFFVYTPFAFIGVLGLLFMLVKKPKQTVWLWLFLGVSIYVLSSWWNWYYGGSFGMRALVEYIPFFALGLTHLIQHSSRVVRTSLITICLVFVSVNLIQSYQYQKFILHWDGMNQERYWEVFLKTDRKYDGIFYRSEPIPEKPSKERILNTVIFETDLEPGTIWADQGINSDKAFSGTRSTRVNSQIQYGSTIGIPVLEMGPKGKKQLHVSAMVWAEQAFPDLTIAYSYRNSNADYGHHYVSIGQFVTDSEKWLKIEETVTLNIPSDTSDTWIIYPMTNGKDDIYLDDIRYEVITLEE